MTAEEKLKRAEERAKQANADVEKLKAEILASRFGRIAKKATKAGVEIDDFWLWFDNNIDNIIMLIKEFSEEDLSNILATHKLIIDNSIDINNTIKINQNIKEKGFTNWGELNTFIDLYYQDYKAMSEQPSDQPTY